MNKPRITTSADGRVRIEWPPFGFSTQPRVSGPYRNIAEAAKAVQAAPRLLVGSKP